MSAIQGKGELPYALPTRRDEKAHYVDTAPNAEALARWILTRACSSGCVCRICERNRIACRAVVDAGCRNAAVQYCAEPGDEGSDQKSDWSEIAAEHVGDLRPDAVAVEIWCGECFVCQIWNAIMEARV